MRRFSPRASTAPGCAPMYRSATIPACDVGALTAQHLHCDAPSRRLRPDTRLAACSSRRARIQRLSNQTGSATKKTGQRRRRRQTSSITVVAYAGQRAGNSTAAERPIQCGGPCRTAARANDGAPKSCAVRPYIGEGPTPHGDERPRRHWRRRVQVDSRRVRRNHPPPTYPDTWCVGAATQARCRVDECLAAGFSRMPAPIWFIE